MVLIASVSQMAISTLTNGGLQKCLGKIKHAVTASISIHTINGGILCHLARDAVAMDRFARP